MDIFNRKDQHCYRIVIENLYHTVPHSAIIEEIAKTDNKVAREIINVRFGADNIPTSTFFVNITPGLNNTAVKQISSIHHQKVVFDRFLYHNSRSNVTSPVRVLNRIDVKLTLLFKREIPVVNYTIHSVHCARNFGMCPVCKEPVPLAGLENHHDKMHKLLPCKQCGEKVCGTDMEDHIRDSCAHTIKSCRFCELELLRRELPLHEGYCGARTEQCPDCKEWVMLKYRQLHIDSNHGFLRLDDDPTPVPKRETAKITNVPKRESDHRCTQTGRLAQTADPQ
ncbi:unnamed protein product [Parnassius apollo]|uniref:(apollo) hypothetical protein n=1 Tax=Parnassius apollo TaxID=110799 RepID=A0A8S3Y2C2_PARAO|nr:unnamed protein product [Parnassius apollo]